MAKLDRLGWADGIAFRSHTARLGIRMSNPDVRDRVATRLPPGWHQVATPRVDILYSFVVGSNGVGGRVRRFNLVYVGSKLVARAMEIDEAMDVMESDLHTRVSLFARDRLFVHAGVVAWRGRAIVIPGRTHSGKSSLVEALVRAGATYYSDEFAVVDAKGRVHPYSKPLSLRGPDGDVPRRVAVEQIGGRVGRRPVPLGLVVDTAYRVGGRWRPRWGSPAQAMMALFDNTVLARIRPRFALDTLEAAAGTAGMRGVLRGPRGEAADMATAVLERIDADSH